MADTNFVPCDFNQSCTHKTRKNECQECWAKDCKYHNLKERLRQSFTICDKLDAWLEEHVKTCQTHATAGEQFEYEFLPSGIVEVQTVRCLVCGKTHTEYVD